MAKNGLEFWINKDIRRRVFDLTLFSHTPDGVVAVVKPVVAEVIDPIETITRPTVSLSFDEATALITELWDAGVRPGNVGQVGELVATKAHLEDMRFLVFKGERP
jgi:hypothetical protein